MSWTGSSSGARCAEDRPPTRSRSAARRCAECSAWVAPCYADNTYRHSATAVFAKCQKNRRYFLATLCQLWLKHRRLRRCAGLGPVHRQRRLLRRLGASLSECPFLRVVLPHELCLFERLQHAVDLALVGLAAAENPAEPFRPTAP